LSLGRQVWKGPPARLEHKAAVQVPDLTHSGWRFQLLSAGSGLELCSQLSAAEGPGGTYHRCLRCWGSAAGQEHSTAFPGKCFDYWGSRIGYLCHLHSRAAAEDSPCLCILEPAFGGSARAWRGGTGKAVKKSAAILKLEKHGQPSVGQYRFNTLCPCNSLLTWHYQRS